MKKPKPIPKQMNYETANKSATYSSISSLPINNDAKTNDSQATTLNIQSNKTTSTNNLEQGY